MKRNLLLSFVAMFIATSSFSQNFWCVTNDESTLFTVNISDGTVVESIDVSATNTTEDLTVYSFQGMTQHPTTGAVYVLFKDDSDNKYFGTMDMSTGIITTIAQTESNLATIAFDNDGVLYAMEGNQSTQMYIIDIATGAETAFHVFASYSSDGEALVFNSTDNLMYRYGGGDDGDWVSLDLGTLAEVTISTMSDLDRWGGALAYRQGQNRFVLGLGQTFYNVLPDGTTTEISNSLGFDGYIKGLVKVSSTAGVNDLTTTGISIYPNPTNNVINVNLGNITGTTIYSLFTIDGKMIDEVHYKRAKALLEII